MHATSAYENRPATGTNRSSIYEQSRFGRVAAYLVHGGFNFLTE